MTRPAIIMDAAERLAKTEHRALVGVAREIFAAEIRRGLEASA
jgi:hypothetical protein